MAKKKAAKKKKGAKTKRSPANRKSAAKKKRAKGSAAKKKSPAKSAAAGREPLQILAELVRTNPIDPGPDKRQQAVQGVLNAKLQPLAPRYAAAATYQATEGALWEIWWRMQQLRALTVEQAISELENSEQCRWFATWAFMNNQSHAGGLAYRRYLDGPIQYGPFQPENTVYLDFLLSQDRHADVISTVQELTTKYGDMTWEQTRAAEARFGLGEQQAALAELEDIRKRYRDDGEVGAQAAIVYSRVGDGQRAMQVLEQALTLGVYNERLVDELLVSFPLTPQQRRTLTDEDEQEEFGFGDLARQWWADPGGIVKPSKRSSPHWYGGDTFQMPDCRGCGHQIRQWFTLDIRKIKPLHKSLPSWTLFPLLGCADCMVWVGRHDYGIDLSIMRVTLGPVTLERIKDFSTPSGTIPSIRKQSASLQWIKTKSDPTENDIEQYGEMGPQVAGTPPWIEEPLTVCCAKCEQEMVFVAAMNSTYEFEPVVPINNESGYQYHFACDDCHAISVIAQCS